jgi:hypothetical protein
LHPEHIILDGQVVKPEATVLEVVNILDPEGIRSPVLDPHAIFALLRDVVVTTEDGPNSTHYAESG